MGFGSTFGNPDDIFEQIPHITLFKYYDKIYTVTSYNGKVDWRYRLRKFRKSGFKCFFEYIRSTENVQEYEPPEIIDITTFNKDTRL